MAYIMDMASGKAYPVEVPEYRIDRAPGTASQDVLRPEALPELQLAMVERQAQPETRSLPAASIAALLKTLED